MRCQSTKRWSNTFPLDWKGKLTAKLLSNYFNMGISYLLSSFLTYSYFLLHVNKEQLKLRGHCYFGTILYFFLLLKEDDFSKF